MFQLEVHEINPVMVKMILEIPNLMNCLLDAEVLLPLSTWTVPFEMIVNVTDMFPALHLPGY